MVSNRRRRSSVNSVLAKANGKIHPSLLGSLVYLLDSLQPEALLRLIDAISTFVLQLPLIVDFLLPRKPVSHQARDPQNRGAWRDYVFGRAHHIWPARPLVGHRVKFIMVYLADEPNPGDINNFVKPVQDALCSCIYGDDSMILDISAHTRFLADGNSSSGLPDKLADAIIAGEACVYVAIHESMDLAEVFK